MPIQPIQAAPSLAAELEPIERAVLDHLIFCLPVQLTVDEIVREVAENPDEFGPCDRVRNAIRDLVGVGLAHRNGAFVMPSRAGMRDFELRETQ